MELRTLRSFLAVAREGNVTRAAASLHVTQPALSRQVAELERELGCALVVRGPRGVSLTEQGVLLRKRAEEIVGLAERAEQEVRTPSAEVAGDVWVGCGESRAVGLVAQAAAALAEAHSGVRLRLFSGNGNDVVERLDKGLLDFGLLLGHELAGGYETLALPWEDRWGLLVRRDHPLAGRERLSLPDLRGLPLIVSSQGAATAEAWGAMGGVLRDEGLTVVATYTLLYNASLLVEQGVGVAVCFDGIVRVGEGTPFAYVPIDGLPPIPSRLVWKRFQPQTRAATAFLAAMQELTGANHEV